MVKGSIVVEFEDVFFDTYKSELRFIQSQYATFCPYINYGENFDFDNREYKDPILSLIKDGNPDDQFDKFTNITYTLTKLLTFKENKDKYVQFLSLSNFGKSLISSKSIINTSLVENIYVISQYINEKEKAVKESIWNDLHLNKKFKLILLSTKESLSDNIKQLNWTLMVSSSRDVIKKIIEDKNYKISGKEFLILNRPYSRLDVKEEILIEEKGATITYYK